MKSLRVAVWGLGNHSITRIIPALSSMKKLSLIGVCSRNKDSVASCALEWNCLTWTSHIEMLKNPMIDVIYIATPIGVHAKQIDQALRAGKHVWCEKPLTCNYEDTKLLISLAKKNKRMLAEAFMYLHHPQFKKVQNFINHNHTGRVHSIICRFGIPFLENPGFRYDPNLCGGSFWDVASYTVSAVLALFPNQDVQVLFSELLNNKEKLSVDTEGRALLRFSHGSVAYLEWGIGVAYKNEIDLWSDTESFFTDKIFSKPEDYQTVYRFRDKQGNESLVNGKKSEQFIDMLSNFHFVYSSSKKINEEYEIIERRAKVMSEIANYAN